MASVKIDLGFGEQAILSERAGSEALTPKHQRDAEEFLRRWPRIRSIQQERSYLQQLGLHVGFCPPGANPSDTSALLRSAVKSGRIKVAIERAAATTGGGVVGSGPSTRPYPLEMRQKAARVAPTPKSYSYDWPQRYDDVSANDLIAYLEDFIGRTSTTTAAADADPTTPLGDAQPFEYSEDSPLKEAEEVAARGVSEEDEAECYAQYERDMDECNAYKLAMGGARFMESCSQRAFMNYQQCRGY
jgi:hypothetical protein